MSRRPFSILCILSLVFLGGCGQGHLHKSRQMINGASVEVISADRNAGKVVFSEMTRIGKLLNAHDPASEISRLNRQGYLKASAETIYVVKKAGQFWRESSGAFDITSNKIGFDKLQISDNIIKFPAIGIKLDLGAIARGYAVDSAVYRLKKAGIKNALISVDGDIYCLGDKKGKPWKVAVQDPKAKNVIGSLYLRDKAVGTYGPVTVIASDSTTADVLAVTVYVLGKDKGLKLARKFGAQILLN
jgi:FAD:protein FMN transferase